jgi:nucleotide-binding universal stress UspA family protein
MLRHILMPLDGSPYAESALAIAERLARKSNGKLTFIHVIEKHAPLEAHRQGRFVAVEEAFHYLDEVSRRSLLTGLRTETHVYAAGTGDVAPSIVEHSAELESDLIILCVYGKEGRRRFLPGGITHQIIALGDTLILIVHPPNGTRMSGEPREFRTVLVALDEDPEHGEGLPIAMEFARAFECRMHLLMVLPKFRVAPASNASKARTSPGTASAKLEAERAAAATYLAQWANELARYGISVESEISYGYPLRAIRNEVRRVSADLVIMGTRCWTGTGSAFDGSAAAELAIRIREPLLLVPSSKSNENPASSYP